MPFPLLTIPVGTAIGSAISYIFRVTFFTILGKLVLFAFINTAAYFIMSYALPDWFSLQTLTSKFDFIFQYPAVNYAFQQLQVAHGIQIILVALTTAWLIKKVPSWVGWGPAMRVLT